MATESDNVNSGALGTLVAVGTFAMLGISLVVTALVRSELADEVKKKEVAADRPYRDLIAEQTAQLGAPAAYKDRGKGLVSLPIDRAMELVVSGLAKDPNSATPPPPVGGSAGMAGGAPEVAGSGGLGGLGGTGGTGATAEGEGEKPEGEEPKPGEELKKEGDQPQGEPKKEPEKPAPTKPAAPKPAPAPAPAPGAPGTPAAPAPVAPTPAPAAPSPAPPNGQ
jgi:hypothetical protein